MISARAWCGRSLRAPPVVQLTEIIADRRYAAVAEVDIPSSQEVVVFAFQGRSWTTHPNAMAYVYRLEGYETDWQWGRARQVKYQELPLGEYLFEDDPPTDGILSLQEYERQYIQKVLEKTNWIVGGPHGAAVLLEMPESSLRYRMQKLDIRRT